MKRAVRSALSAALLGATVLLTGCASKPETTLEVTWASPQLPPASSFKKLLIITVASSEFVQEAFQNQMAAELKKQGVNAVASRRYFTIYTDVERDRFKRSIDESDADFILLARVTNTSQKSYENRATIIGPGGVPYGDASGIEGAYARAFYPGSVVAGADATVKTVTSEASIFAAKGQKLIWSARIRTTNTQSTTGADYAPEYVGVVLEAMKKDKLL
jgi:hypothetical protein